ncbi:uncharacterized protein LOC127288000 isoform X2 [Leptopilina boulardi]|uniref:uncharacterized protein LOC127278719 isoform X2 n=1 Tax=Leptopilina boulardi TaxID=63433 RepID=UPI0021F53DCE|nr:uncharacterized protein LOC127278719 isoform X2 [Leptopilina boulardi]XP_051171135.1 uncharacterized protein LOC127288000 isoform X2 [Leptopilina boulardi]
MKSKKRDSNTHKKSNFTEDIKSKNSHNNIAPNKQMPKISKVQKPKGAKANRNDAESLKSDNQSEFLQDSDNGNSDNEIIKSQIELSKSEVPKSNMNDSKNTDPVAIIEHVKYLPGHSKQQMPKCNYFNLIIYIKTHIYHTSINQISASIG